MRRTMICLAFVCTVACGDEGPTPVAPTPTAPSPSPSPSPPPPVSTSFRATGTVVEFEGGPVADATVIAFSCSGNFVFGQTLTDVSGRFTLEVQSSSGRPCLRVEKEGYEARSIYSEPIDGVTLRIQRLRRATGTVVEVDGGPVAGARVWAPGTAALTDANGRFVLDGVGRWLSVQAEGYESSGIAVPEGRDLAVGVVPIQRTILISGGMSFAGRISSNDINIDLWDEGNWCTCKWIRLDTGGRELNVRLQWFEENALQLLASEDGYSYKAATAQPGGSASSILVSAATHFLIVGVRNQASVFQPPLPHTLPPIAFELTTSVR